MARLRSSLLGIFVIGALLGTACGEDPAPAKGGSSNDDDDDDDDNTSKKDAGKDAGKASDAGKKDGGAAAAASVECGSKKCTATASALPTGAAPTPCCFDEAEEICGVSSPLMPGVCGGPVEDDERCPTVMALGMQAAGCCIEANNHCGINASALGAGCADLASPMLRQFVPGAPPAQTCDGELLEPAAPTTGTDAGKPATGADAGKSDAGASTATDAGKADAGKADAGR